MKKSHVLFVFFLLFYPNFTFTQQYEIKIHFVRNDFPGGKVIIDGVQSDVPLEPQFIYPYNNILGVEKSWAGPDIHSVTAFNYQSSNGVHIFVNWNLKGVFHTYDLSYSFVGGDLTSPIEHEAQYLSTCNVNFANSFIGVGNGGYIKVNNSTYPSPTNNFQLTEPNNSITVTALNQVLNGIQYIFTNWDDGSTTLIKTYNPVVNKTYTANFAGKPLSYSVMTHTLMMYPDRT